MKTLKNVLKTYKGLKFTRTLTNLRKILDPSNPKAISKPTRTITNLTKINETLQNSYHPRLDGMALVLTNITGYVWKLV